MACKYEKYMADMFRRFKVDDHFTPVLLLIFSFLPRFRKG